MQTYLSVDKNRMHEARIKRCFFFLVRLKAEHLFFLLIYCTTKKIVKMIKNVERVKGFIKRYKHYYIFTHSPLHYHPFLGLKLY